MQIAQGHLPRKSEVVHSLNCLQYLAILGHNDLHCFTSHKLCKMQQAVTKIGIFLMSQSLRFISERLLSVYQKHFLQQHVHDLNDN